MEKPPIVILRPMNHNDATLYTYEWGQEFTNTITQYKYPLIDIKKDDVTCINVQNSLKKYKPRMLISLSNGTPSCIRGQNECVISRKFNITKDNNQDNILDKMIVIAISSYTTLQLGKCTVSNGTESYFGYDDIVIFPSDEINSQYILRDIHLVYLKSLLEGNTIKTSEKIMNDYEDSLIKLHKETKYISLPLLWNKKHRKILGNKDVKI